VCGVVECSFFSFGRRDSAGFFALAFAALKRLRISRRSRTQQRIVRGGDSVRQHQRIEVDVARGTCIIALHVVDRQCSCVDLLPIRRPGNRRVIGRVFRLTDRDDQVPLQRMAMDGCN
jgi:hypothetical protein